MPQKKAPQMHTYPIVGDYFVTQKSLRKTRHGELFPTFSYTTVGKFKNDSKTKSFDTVSPLDGGISNKTWKMANPHFSCTKDILPTLGLLVNKPWKPV